MVFGLVSGVILIINLGLPYILKGFFSTYVMQPFIWGLLSLIILRLPQYRGAVRLHLRSLAIKLALGIAFLQVYLNILAGLMGGFGQSPNSLTTWGIAINLFYVGTNLLGVELSRAWLLNRLLRKPDSFLPIFLAFVYTLFSLHWNRMLGPNATLEAFTKLVSSECLPTFMENLTATFLAMWGGWLPALAYRGILQGFYWFSPFLPVLNWAMKALTGTVVPVVGLAVIQEVFFSKIKSGKLRRGTGNGLVSWVILSVVSVIIIWFCIGVFPIRPTVIISGSMQPTFEVGDIVVVAHRNPQLLAIGDIVQFRTNDMLIPTVHRIIDVRREQNQKVFVTKGDANANIDLNPVYPEYVVGKVIFVLPRIGRVAITMRQFISAGGN